MGAKTVLRGAIVLEWVCVLCSVGLSFALAGHLPAPLQAWRTQDFERGLTGQEMLVGAAMVVVLLAGVVASLGVFLLQRWAAWLYLTTRFVGCLLLPFTGPTVEHALTDAVDEVGTLLSGVVLGLAFFSGAVPTVGSGSTGVGAVS
jgi:type IV secretory pathway TrbD component